MNIKSLADETGISSATIRYYETEGFIPAPIRRGNGYRSYTEDYVDKLNLIKICQSLGFKLEEISQLMWGEEPKEHDRILAALLEKQSHIVEVIAQFEEKRQKLSLLHGVLSKAWDAGECLSTDELSELIEA
ncbi:MAG: DNA-binding transcriptional MerR regulator [Arenicella sp.]|jgi:DNA-binding transcriptional MerR regulator